MGIDPSFATRGTEFHLVFSALSILLLFSMPWIFLKVLRIAKRSKPPVQKRLWLIGELSLAIGLFLVFFATLSSVVVSAKVISPWLWGLRPETIQMDVPMTSRLFFHWMTVSLAGWVVFRGVGLNALRDTHKSLKECHDLVLQNARHERRKSSSGAAGVRES